MRDFEPMFGEDKARIRRAGMKAKKIYPGPVGEVLNRWLLEWEEFGYTFSKDSTILKLIEFLEKMDWPVKEDIPNEV